MVSKQKEKAVRDLVIAAGWIILVALTFMYPIQFTNPLFVFFAVAIIVANSFPLDIKVGQITQAFAFQYLAMMILGPVYAAWISVIGIVGQGIRSKHRSIDWYLINTAIHSTSIIVAGFVFLSLGGSVLITNREGLISPISFFPVFAGAITHFIVNVGFVYPLIQVRYGKDINYKELWNVLQWDFLAKMVFAPLAFYIYLGYGNAELKNLIVPVFLLISLWIFIRKSIELSVLKRKLDSQLKRIESQHQIAKAAHSSLDINEVFETIAFNVRNLYKCELNSLHIVNKFGFQEPPISSKESLSECCEFYNTKLFKKIVNFVMMKSKPFVTGNKETICTIIGKETEAKDECCSIESLAAYPLSFDGRLVGVISLTAQEKDHFERIKSEMIEFVTGELSSAIANAQLHEDLKRAYNERSEELKIAASIQRNVLPSDYMTEKVKVGSKFSAAKLLGGDFYEIAPRSDGQIAIGVGDVSGKGLPAALTMMRIVTILRKLSRQAVSSKAVLDGLNSELDWESVESNSSKQYATCFFALLDQFSGTFRYSCAGHVSPFIFRQNEKKVELFENNGGFPLGMFSDGQLNDDTIHLSPGDKVILYTDGAMDTVDHDGDRFSIKRLQRVVEDICAQDEPNIASEIHKRIMEFRGDAQLADDIAIVSIEYFGDIDEELCELRAAIEQNLTFSADYNS